MDNKTNLVLAAVILATPAGAQSLPDGVWTGITRVLNGPPIGAIVTARTTSAGKITAITTMSCPDGCQLDDPRLVQGLLTFSWTAPDGVVFACRLQSHRADRYLGACLAGTDSITMTLQGPELADQWGPLGVARDLLDGSGVRWDRRAWNDIRLYAPRGSRAAKRFDQFERETREALVDITFVLHLPGWGAYTEPLDLFFVDSRADMQRIVGSALTGLADPISRAAVMVVDTMGRAPLRRELAHVASWRSWRQPGLQTEWMQEGFAVYFDWRPCLEDNLNSVAGYLDGQGLFSTTEALIEKSRDFDSPLPSIQSGSLARYVLERYGLAGFQELWHRGMDQLTFVTGTTVPRLDESWRAWIHERARQPRIDWKQMGETACR